MPAPVAPGGFTPLDPAHAGLNVRVALERVGAFFFGGGGQGPPGAPPHGTTPDDEPLWCDLQTHPTDNSARRLGAGRAGEYRRMYLKGVGRTPLAANWSDPEDLYHATGHLSVSSLLREHLATRVLRRRGLGDTVVGVDAILVRPLSASERSDLATHLAPAAPGLTPADRTLAGLVGRSADFARISNVVWALSHVDQRVPAIAERFLAFEQALSPGTPDPEGDPEALARAAVAAFERGLDNFARWFRAGMYWNCFHDNFSLDGRYVDLETAVYLGAPALLGVQSPDGSVTGWVGCEALHLVWQWRVFVRWLVQRCRFIARYVVSHPAARGFLRAVASELERAFRGSILFDDARIVARASGVIADALDLDAKERTTVDAIVAARARALFGGRPAAFPELRLAPLPWQPAQSNATVHQVLLAPDFVLARYAPPDDARGFRDDVERLERVTDPQELLAGLAVG